jgi:glutathione S-transferase
MKRSTLVCFVPESVSFLKKNRRGISVVQLVDADIKTRGVLEWKGIHVFHFFLSVCSQKLRIFLNLKGVPWRSHPVDLFRNENLSDWFLGINPRGLVPVLVHDGVVHIESNDIITYLEKTFPQPRLIPAGHENEVAGLLHHEDELHSEIARRSEKICGGVRDRAGQKGRADRKADRFLEAVRR